MGKVIEDTKTKSEECLKCGESFGAVRSENLICGSVDYFGELEAEFGNHKWAKWSDKELSNMFIKPEFYEQYRFSNWNTIIWTDDSHKTQPLEL